jgi:hypothetical protein
MKSLSTNTLHKMIKLLAQSENMKQSKTKAQK